MGITQCYLPRDTSEHNVPHFKLTPARQRGTRFIYPGGIEGWVDLSVQFQRRTIDKKTPTCKLKHANSILEYCEHLCQISSKSIVIIWSYTVSKFARFLRDTVYLTWSAVTCLRANDTSEQNCDQDDIRFFHDLWRTETQSRWCSLRTSDNRMMLLLKRQI